MNCSAQLWGPMLEASPELRAVEVLRPRLAGATLDDCVTHLLDRLPDRFALAGLSLGAIVAMALVRTAPHRVERLALLAANPRAPLPAQREAWAAQRRELASGRTARDLQRDLLPVLLSPEARSSAMDEAALRMADETGEHDLDEQLCVQDTRIDERPALAQVTVPVTVVAGESDALVPVERNAEVHGRVRGSRLVVLPGVGHLSPLEAPVAVATALRAWQAE